MRLEAARIKPMSSNEWTPEQAEILGPRHQTKFYNAIGSFARNWTAFQRFDGWMRYVMGRSSSIAPRQREILILRIAHLCRSDYEWAQHVIFGKAAGLGDEELESIRTGADAEVWSTEEAALLRAADELHGDSFISDAVWEVLSETFEPHQLIDIVFAVGQYTMVAMLLNRLGVQFDAGMHVERRSNPRS